MAHLAQQAIGAILDNYADVIEGGNAYNSGTSYKGIPGTQTSDDQIRNGSDGSFATSGAGDTTTLAYASGNWPQTRWLKSNSPGYFAYDTNGNASGEARRITDWDNTAKEFTTDAFSAAPGSGATISVYQGFKRIPNDIDILGDPEQSGFADGYDRYFDLSLRPTSTLDWYGNNTETWAGVLRLLLRFVKFAREHDHQARCAENLTIIASAMTIQAGPGTSIDHRDGTYTRALFAPEGEPEVIVDDDSKIVMQIEFPIHYRINRSFK
jgi:hypothetical protein